MAFDGMATPGADFTDQATGLAPVSIVVPAGSTEATMAIDGLNDDPAYEGHETIVVTIAGVTNGEAAEDAVACALLLDMTPSPPQPVPGMTGGVYVWDPGTTTLTITRIISSCHGPIFANINLLLGPGPVFQADDYVHDTADHATKV